MQKDVSMGRVSGVVMFVIALSYTGCAEQPTAGFEDFDRWCKEMIERHQKDPGKFQAERPPRKAEVFPRPAFK